MKYMVIAIYQGKLWISVHDNKELARKEIEDRYQNILAAHKDSVHLSNYLVVTEICGPYDFCSISTRTPTKFEVSLD